MAHSKRQTEGGGGGAEREKHKEAMLGCCSLRRAFVCGFSCCFFYLLPFVVATICR